MPLVVHSDDAGSYEQLFSLAGAGQITAPSYGGTPPPSPFTIGASSNWTSGLMFSMGFKALSVGLTSTQAGAINIQRYLDLAGTVVQGAASTVAIVANTAVVLNVYDNLPFTTFTIQVTNTGGSTATVNPFGALMNAT